MSHIDKHVFRFGMESHGIQTESHKEDAYRVGGKGANLAEMCHLGLPVPPGFSISCDAYRVWSENNSLPETLVQEIMQALEDLEACRGAKLGDIHTPLLVSVRSGAPVSMPGMMDTVLNLGLNDETVLGLIAQTGDERFAWDSYRRFIQMFSDVVMDIHPDIFENALTSKKLICGYRSDSELTASDLQELCCEFKSLFVKHLDRSAHPEVLIDGTPVFPSDPYTQLILAIQAVFSSWMSSRACLYRQQNSIDDSLGTAVNVQAMVFGNRGNTSATGVAFTRNPATGKQELYGDFLVGAQGEDVVAGIRNTSPLQDLSTTLGFETSYAELQEVFQILEQHYRDMCDIEFTIEEGKLWILQTRIAKRSAQAAITCAVDMALEGLITKEMAVSRVSPQKLDQLMHPQLDSTQEINVLAQGLNASPGAAVGALVFSSQDAVAMAQTGAPCILARWETTPDDLAGMVACEGILTSHGGKTSHAAVIARGMGKPCVCGAESLRIDAQAKQITVGTTILREGDLVTIDGSTGIVSCGALKLKLPQVTGDLDTLLAWADEIRLFDTRKKPVGIRVNADTPQDARLALRFGAEAIGLCRTEHMFLGDRKHIIADYILNSDIQAKEAAVRELLAVQTQDFKEMLEIMDGKDMVVRLLDPPLHEFLDNARSVALQVQAAELQDNAEEAALLKVRLDAIDAASEANPMLGLRGCRLGIVCPDLIEMQVRALVVAACELKIQGFDPRPEIMVPLVSVAEELRLIRDQIEHVIHEVCEQMHTSLTIPIGTMLELPHACIQANQIAHFADFVSFGTNDLTQTCFGFSRDDCESSFIPTYLRRKILQKNPFETLDKGVNELIKMGIDRARSIKPELTAGVCGEVAGDPLSIRMLYNDGVSYVSSSPYRLPVVRLSLAHAVLNV